MASEEDCSGRVQLLLTRTTASFVGAPASEPLTVPSHCASRSELIKDLSEELSDETMLPLPLVMDDVKAWLDLATASRDASSAHYSAKHEDDKLLRAIKAADFLRDDATMADAADSLGDSMYEVLLEHSASRSISNSTSCASEPWTPVLPAGALQSLQAWAGKIVRAVPQSTVVTILTRAHKKYSPAAAIQGTARTEEALLQLLPRSFHPAIVQACCLHPADRRYCFWQHVHACACAACTPQGGRNAQGWARPQSRCTGATPTFQLLAAGAPLAGGSMDRPWSHETGATHATADQVRVTHGLSAPSMGNLNEGLEAQASGNCAQPSPKRRCLELAAAQHACKDADAGEELTWRLPSGCELTRLKFPVCLDDAVPRWTDALAQWRTLCALHAVLCTNETNRGDDAAGEAARAGASKFTAALQCLPALTELRLDLMGRMDREAAAAGHVSMPSAFQLLDGISGLTNLAVLDLSSVLQFPCAQSCNSNGRAESTSQGCTPGRSIASLSRLSMLTYLKFNTWVSGRLFAPEFAAAVKQMPALQELHAVLEVDKNEEATSAAEAMLLDLVSGPGLPALQHLHLAVSPVLYSKHDARVVEISIERLHVCIRDQNAALLTRMAALQLDVSQCTAYAWDGRAVPALVQSMSSLQWLHLGDNNVDNAGMQSLAAVLPSMLHLTYLNIDADDNYSHRYEVSRATHAGLLPLLASLLEPGAAGHQRLQELHISNIKIGPERGQRRTARLAKLLRQFRGLRRLVMRYMFVDLAESQTWMRKVMAALETLPELRSLAAGDFGGSAYASAFLSEFPGLHHLVITT